MTTKSKISICGAADLLAAIYCEDRAVIRERFGLPLPKGYYKCLQCGQSFFALDPRRFCSKKCRYDYQNIDVVCTECGRIFKRRYSELTYRTTRGQKYWFCSHECGGRWAGRNYGFHVHPENIIKGAEGRKWDWDLVAYLRAEGYTYDAINAELGIPYVTIAAILRKRGLTQKYKYDHDYIRKRLEEGVKPKQISEEVGASLATIYKIIKKAKHSVEKG